VAESRHRFLDGAQIRPVRLIERGQWHVWVRSQASCRLDHALVSVKRRP
jgi:hypothetical protein